MSSPTNAPASGANSSPRPTPADESKATLTGSAKIERASSNERRAASEVDVVFLETAKNVPPMIRPLTPQSKEFVPGSTVAAAMAIPAVTTTLVAPAAAPTTTMIPETSPRQHAPAVLHCCIVCDVVERNATDLQAHLLKEHSVVCGVARCSADELFTRLHT
jgi:hypothetical protein